ncbi:MAG: hypothetical protein PWQ41_1360 [Bacillota bacterium]|jgi:hypothetical protein|nr:hypothetical protein [Bacillota bacterium]MDK2925586.1 hypothetical protein [Bacillota bacterium]
MREEKGKLLTRRTFLKGAATAAGITLLSGAGGLLLSGCSASQTSAQKKPEWPYPYKKLDSGKAADRAYKAYKEGG